MDNLKSTYEENGRPSKYSDERAAKIVNYLRVGASRAAASQGSGITYQTFLNWLRAHDDFAGMVAEAEAQAEITCTVEVFKAAKNGDVKAAIEWLKRRRPGDWSETLRNEQTGANGGPIEIATLTDAERAARIASLVDAARTRGTG